MDLDQYAALDATGLADLVRRGEVDPRELLDTAAEALQQVDGELNAVVDHTYDYALEQLEAGVDLAAPFCGVPFVLKDCGGVAAGIRSTQGSRLAGDGVYAAQDSELFRRMKRAGVLVIGTSATSEFCIDSTTETLRHGATRNPWRLDQSAGGSSGGSAAVVAAGGVPIAHGSDGGGSIRIPAAMCGVVGFKPSRFRVPTGPSGWDPGGTVSFILSRTVRDSAAMLDAVEGPDVGYYGAAAGHSMPYVRAIGKDPPRLKIAYMLHAPYGDAFASPECAQAVLAVVDVLRGLGHQCEEAYPAISEEYQRARIATMCDGIAQEIEEMARSTGLPISPDTLEPMVYQTYQDSLHRRGYDVYKGRRILAASGREMGRFFTRYDLLISPTVGKLGRKLGELNGFSRPEMTMEEWVLGRREYACITPLANVVGLPSISLPLCMSEDGLPIGIELDAGIDQDQLVLQVSAQLERAMPWHGRRPQIYAGTRESEAAR